jgi:hypothetical protein
MKRYTDRRIAIGLHRYQNDENFGIEETLRLFRLLVKTGYAWRCQTEIQRDARRLICAGLVDYSGPIPARAMGA